METEEADSSIEDFYSGVILLSLLNPLKDLKRPQSHLHAKGQQSVYAKRCFLDDLSFLFDYQPAGKTVTAIAGEHKEAGPIFWVVTTQDKTEETLIYLNEVLRLLQDIHLNFSNKAETLSSSIAAASIDKSKTKVKNYRKIITKVMSKAISSNHHPTTDLGKCCTQQLRTDRCTKLTNILFPDKSLSRDLKRLIESPNNDYDLCSFAYSFRNTGSMKHLKSKSIGTVRPELWSLVRHYIGRLGFWFKASKRIVEFCQKQPLLLKGFHVKSCPKAPAIMSPGVEVSTKIQDVLGRMLPNYESDRLAQTLQRGQADEAVSISERYASKSSPAKFRPQVHAEVVLLEHFYQNNLRYLGDDKYIGCSKASCYCCNLYFKYHPAGLEARPCHGNVWCQWSLPTSVTESAGSLPGKAILQSMFDAMMADLSSYVTDGPQHRRKPPDSTTEISSKSSYSWP